jgi:hypothetical protein
MMPTCEALCAMLGGGATQGEMDDSGMPDDGQVTEQIDLMFLRLMTWAGRAVLPL